MRGDDGSFVTATGLTTEQVERARNLHLVDHARAYIERHYKRPLIERLMRTMLAALLPVSE